jgi:hypothetical protein
VSSCKRQCGSVLQKQLALHAQQRMPAGMACVLHCRINDWMPAAICALHLLAYSGSTTAIVLCMTHENVSAVLTLCCLRQTASH